MLIITKNGGFIADAQIEENVKGLCKQFFDEDDAQILGNVNTLSEKISHLPDTHFGANVNTPNVNFFCAMDLHADIVEKLEEMELCYHYAMKEYPISELVRITRRYAKLRNAFRTLDTMLMSKVQPYADAYFGAFVKCFSKNNSKNVKEV
jgi:hypothetical protein